MLLSPHHCLFPLLVAPLTKEPELLEEVANIGKDAANEAAKIVAMEGQEHIAGDIQEAPRKQRRPLAAHQDRG